MKHIITLTVILIWITALFAVNAEAILVDAGKSDIPGIIAYAPDRIVVKFDASLIDMMDKKSFKYGKTGIPALDELGIKHDVSSIKQQFPNAKKKMYKGREVNLSGWHKLKFSGRTDVLSAVEDYKKIHGVIDAQPVSIHTVYRIPSDEVYGEQWHLPKIGAPDAWDIETGNSNITVAVLDTGVRYFHKDLGGANASLDFPTYADGNMWINWTEKNGTNSVDDDGNGKVDDWIGWDFVETTPAMDFLVYCYPGEDCSADDNDPRDFNGHGTHCAGSVAAMNDNGYAAASVAGGWCNDAFSTSGNGVKVMPLRIGWSSVYVFFEVGMVAMDYAAEALYYAADNGARIASCSWGSENTGGIGDAINYFLASGGLIFKAAGNDYDESFDYMGSRNDIIKVAATDQNDCKADFSNYGTWINISAPGVSIWSLYHVHDDPANEYVAYLDGTSMAAPLAASVAALIWSQNPSLSAEQVKQKLYESAENIYGLGCNSLYAGKLGAGRINAFKAVSSGSPPVANFSGNPTSGYKPLIVQFTDFSTGSITSRSWNFGDGSTSTEQNPSHTYNAAGTYTASLTVTGPGGTDIETKTNYIQVTEAPAVAGFSGSPTSGYRPLTVQFTDGSTGTINSWAWDFGDGWTSPQRNPSHTYNSAGTYTVSLSVTGPGGIDTETKMNYINVIQPTQKVGVDNLKTGRYVISGRGGSRTVTFVEAFSFSPGEAIIIRASVKDVTTGTPGSPVPNASVNISITGPATVNLTTGLSNASGIAEAKWQTTKPTKKGIGGTPKGGYTATSTNVTATGYTWDGARTSAAFSIQ